MHEAPNHLRGIIYSYIGDIHNAYLDAKMFTKYIMLYEQCDKRKHHTASAPHRQLISLRLSGNVNPRKYVMTTMLLAPAKSHYSESAHQKLPVPRESPKGFT